MSSKNNTEVIIDGKIFTLSGYESEEYLQKVANYINNKISEFKKEEAYRRQNIDVQKALLNLNIADDYFKAKKQADALENDLESKDKQLYDVKHELISVQIKLDACEKEKEELSVKLADAQKEIIRLETRISEMKENEAAETIKTPRKITSRSKNSSDKGEKVSSSKSSKSGNSSKIVKEEVPVDNMTEVTADSTVEKTDNTSFEQMDFFGMNDSAATAPSDAMVNEVDKILSSLGDDNF